MMRDELAVAVEASLIGPLAPRRVTAAQARLTAALEAIDVDLPACAEYAQTTDPGLLPSAERELEQARLAAGAPKWRL